MINKIDEVAPIAAGLARIGSIAAKTLGKGAATASKSKLKRLAIQKASKKIRDKLGDNPILDTSED